MTTRRLMLRGATVVHPRDGSQTPDADVLVEDGRITRVTAGAVNNPGDDVTIVDVTGRFIVPGLQEMHAHPLESDVPGCYELMVAHGITGFRQMSGSLDLLRKRQQGTLGLPGMSPRLHEMPGPLLTPLNGSTEKQVREAVREQAAAGADFVKSGMLTPETFTAAQDEARRLGLPILGHLPAGIDVEEASRRGIRSIEHLGPGIPLLACCSRDGEHVREEARAGRTPRVPRIRPKPLAALVERGAGRLLKRLLVNPANLTKPADIELLAQAVASFDLDEARRLADRFVADGTWNVPTLIRLKSQYLCDDAQFTQADELRYVDPAALTRWKAATHKHAGFPAKARETFRSAYDRLLELTRVFDETGVPMLAGSDVCGAGWLVPGYALHHELDELDAAGLSPLRVLQMATSDAGDYLGTPDRVGAVTAGADADLVVLEADPRLDVRHLRRIRAVVLRGRRLDRGALDAALARAELDKPAF